MTAAIRQHTDTTAALDHDVTFSSAVLAGSLILVRSARGKTTTQPSFATAGFTKLGGVQSAGTGGVVEDSAAAAIWAKIATGGETVFTRDATTGEQYMCGYEITGAGTIAAISVLSASDAGTGATSDIGTFSAALGLAFNIHLVTAQEAGIHAYSGVNAGDFTEIHDRYVTFTTGNPDDAFFWMGNATGSGSDLDSAVTFSGSPPIVNTAGIAVLIAAAPVPGVWVDWDQDGFDDGTISTTTTGQLARTLPEAGSSGTVSDNITPDVVSFDWTRGASSDHVGQPSPGTCTIIVKNGSNAIEPGKYTPAKSTSTLFGKLRPGLPVWIGRNADGTLSGTGQTVHGVWAGYVRQIVPIPGEVTSDTATAEIICEDPLGYYGRQPVKVETSTERSYTDLRTAVLDYLGETRFDLDPEPDTLPLSSADADSALRVLEAINTATGSRHFIEPADTKEAWYDYRVVTRHHKLTDATDFSLNADNIQSADGYRVTEENVVNFQQVDLSPAHFLAGTDTVWRYADATFPLTSKRTIWATFDDFVKDAALDYASTGGTVTTAFANFGSTAKIEMWSASSVISNLAVEGRMISRDGAEAVTSEDVASQLTYGKRAGPTVSSEYVGSAALGQGLADFLVWRFGTAHPRMAVAMTNILSTLNGRTLYDTLALTFDRLYLAGNRFEIIGETGACDLAASATLVHWITTYELQETANQSALDLFTFDESVFNGSDVLAR